MNALFMSQVFWPFYFIITASLVINTGGWLKLMDKMKKAPDSLELTVLAILFLFISLMGLLSHFRFDGIHAITTAFFIIGALKCTLLLWCPALLLKTWDHLPINGTWIKVEGVILSALSLFMSYKVLFT